MFDWIILSGREGEILEGTERVCLLGQRSCPHPLTSQLTNQQFINCAFLERTASPCTRLCVPSLYPYVRSSTARPVYALRVSLTHTLLKSEGNDTRVRDVSSLTWSYPLVTMSVPPSIFPLPASIRNPYTQHNLRLDPLLLSPHLGLPLSIRLMRSPT